MNPPAPRYALLRKTLIGCAGLLLLAAFSLYLWLRQSLPSLDGALTTAGISGPISIERDAQGIVEINAGERNDLAYGLGFVHAQERFFQMDLQRRAAAGELAELFGEPALAHDRQVRLHQFRARAARNIAHFTEPQRQLLSAYTRGVNAGLQALGARPFEYGLLQQQPVPWRDEDSLLTVFAMILVLQDDQAWFERTRAVMAELLPADLYAFFSQQGGRWDAPLIEDPVLGAALPPAPLPDSGWAQLLSADQPLVYRALQTEDAVVGSNNWAVAGALSEHGGAMVADDMHLAIRVPNIWFRAQWRLPDTGQLISGASLPGAPLMVAGSNGKLAWGFTNTQGDWSDIIQLETNEDQSAYRTAEGWQAFELAEETIQVKGAAPETLTVRLTRWGPVIGQDFRGRLQAMIWTAHFPEGANMNATALETAGNVDEALQLAPSLGIPHQNLVLADQHGDIAWTIAGPFPKRVGTDGKLPESWADGGKYWDGFRGLDQHPRLARPANQRLWTANARTLSGTAFEMMGDSAYALGARQQQIRDALLARDRFDEQALLDIQLDDRALFLAPWRQRILDRLAQEPTLSPMLTEARQQIENWGGHAAIESVGYRLVREFRLKAIELMTAPLITAINRQDPGFDYARANRQMEYPAWALLNEQPAHLLNPDFDSWDELELFALTQVLEPLFGDGTLANDTWGDANRVQIQHPLARALAPIDWALSMPKEPLRGDTHMPRVQTPTHGASERFAVSPGKEAQGYFHMATGQSAHPLSPFFGAGHRDWVDGRASPWLKGESRYRLVLEPAR